MDFEKFGYTLSKIRKDYKISQSEISEALQISRATLSSFENGRGVDIGFKKVLQICDYLGYELSLDQKSPFPVFEDIVNG